MNSNNFFICLNCEVVSIKKPKKCLFCGSKEFEKINLMEDDINEYKYYIKCK